MKVRKCVRNFIVSLFFTVPWFLHLSGFLMAKCEECILILLILQQGVPVMSTYHSHLFIIPHIVLFESHPLTFREAAHVNYFLLARFL